MQRSTTDNAESLSTHTPLPLKDHLLSQFTILYTTGAINLMYMYFGLQMHMLHHPSPRIFFQHIDHKFPGEFGGDRVPPPPRVPTAATTLN